MRYELTDHEWTAIKPMLPHHGAICPAASGRMPAAAALFAGAGRTWRL